MSLPLFPKAYADIVQRLRVPSGVFLLLGFVFLSRPGPGYLLAGLPVCAAGLAWRSWAAGHLRKNRQLTTSGPYAWHRNPLYAGTLVASLGCAIAGGGGWLLALAGAVFVLVYLPVMQLEEQHLASLFPEFEAYAARVPQLMLKRPDYRGREHFDWGVWRVNKEWKGITAFSLLYVFLLAKLLLAPRL